MLQFIVLGMVPGTQIQVTFGWVLLAVSILSLGILWRLEYARVMKWLASHSKRSDLSTN